MSRSEILEELSAVIADRMDHPRPGSYVGTLVGGEKGIDRALEKVGEEATEFVIAVKNRDSSRIIAEAADLQFHLMVAVRAAGIDYSSVLDELAARRH